MSKDKKKLLGELGLKYLSVVGRVFAHLCIYNRIESHMGEDFVPNWRKVELVGETD